MKGEPCVRPGCRRKNDRPDARDLCVRLARHLDGHPHELHPIRIPTRAERERRELGRQRNFWVREVRRLENHGRALRLEFEYAALPGGRAGPNVQLHHVISDLTGVTGQALRARAGAHGVPTRPALRPAGWKSGRPGSAAPPR